MHAHPQPPVLPLILLLALGASLGAAEYFLSPTGNDGNAGTSIGAPLKSWSAANARLAPGDVLTLLDGTYPTGEITVSGTAGAWITVRAKNRRVPLISLAESARLNPGNGGVVEWNGLLLADVAYVKVVGLSVRGWNPSNQIVSSGHGICIQGSHHIVVEDCRIRDCSGSGISGSPEYWTTSGLVNGPLDFITITGNEVSGCAFWNQYQTHGISLWKCHSAGLGADPSGFNCVIRNNIAYANENKVGPWGGPVSGATDGNGIILDCNNDNAYPHATLVEGNLVFANGGRGIHALRSDRVTARYNTCWKNNTRDLDGTWKQGELNADGSAHFHAHDNIAVANTHAWASALSLHSFGGAVPGAVLTRNLISGAREVDGTVALSESGTITGDPLLVAPSADPTVADFRLQAASPAVDAADATPAPAADLAGVSRPQGAANDLGAYERVSAVADTTPPPKPAAPGTTSTTSAMPTFSGVTEAWATVGIFDNGVLIATVTADGAGAWSYTPAPPLPPGSHAIRVTATDAAGNTSPSSNAVHLVVPAAGAASGSAPASVPGADGSGGCGAGSAIALLAVVLALGLKSRNRPR